MPLVQSAATWQKTPPRGTNHYTESKYMERAMAAASDEARFEKWMKENNIQYQTPLVKELRFNDFKKCLCYVEAQFALRSQSNRETAMTASDEADMKRFEEWMKEYNKQYPTQEEKELN
ncbi:hypothetical protein QVD17_39222 [Tagetes erecta]|uniref:Cathepsin propeptide inhibitor domain-containing protein n=1 Tax=Tagetes erecta TaxID=13708 RepID=A0AAD8JN65_TARER|nr:hypothetical protein QVD17_39222 [Tagetes erecta]